MYKACELGEAVLREPVVLILATTNKDRRSAQGTLNESGITCSPPAMRLYIPWQNLSSRGEGRARVAEVQGSYPCVHEL
jgi:hypothetical protein